MTSKEFLKIRNYMGLSQNEFSEKTGINQGLISQYEAGKREIPDYISKLLTALKKDK